MPRLRRHRAGTVCPRTSPTRLLRYKDRYRLCRIHQTESNPPRYVCSDNSPSGCPLRYSIDSLTLIFW
ncbi:MAG: hypothetical protein E7569_14930 [Ruminococcaceae bacterium]|nr:hypothetical protein [Oscillospiraceae bacterium]